MHNDVFTLKFIHDHTFLIFRSRLLTLPVPYPDWSGNRCDNFRIAISSYWSIFSNSQLVFLKEDEILYKKSLSSSAPHWTARHRPGSRDTNFLLKKRENSGLEGLKMFFLYLNRVFVISECIMTYLY